MRPVVLLYTSQAAADFGEYAMVLAQHGYEVRHCASAAVLRHEARLQASQAAQGGEPVLAILAAATPLNRAAASILAGLPRVGVLAQIDSCADASLIATLQLGIDAWCPRTCSPEVLALALHSLKRRLERGVAGGAMHQQAPGLGCQGVVPGAGSSPATGPPPASEGQWQLRDQAWVLETPSGRRLRLTSSERNFMLTLLQNPDSAASHDDLSQRKGWRPADAQMAKRRLGVLVSRLRRKVEQHEALPIKSVHNWGYMFAGSLVLWGAAGPSGSGDPAALPDEALP